MTRFFPFRLNVRWMLATLFAAGFLAVSQGAIPVSDNSDAEADRAWQKLEQAAEQPEPPAEWRTQRPTEEEIARYREGLKAFVEAGAARARDFYTRFPKHAKALEARKMEFGMLMMAVMQMGRTNNIPQLETAEKDLLQEPGLSENDRFEIRSMSVQRAAMSQHASDPQAAMAELEKGARALQKEFPKRPEVYGMLLEVASEAEGDKARALVREVIDSADAPEQVKAAAQGRLRMLDAQGKPLPIKFKALDGRDVDLAKLKGKVVLLDFWATWCGPCVAELPKVKAAYEKLHAKGFEIIGISFDQDKAKLEKFVATEKMSWPQYFDGKGWENKLGQDYGIQSIPAMWLVDKKGNLRDLEARGDLDGKVSKLLAE
jgi:thiol-disulfide isomerase/thioredoxin